MDDSLELLAWIIGIFAVIALFPYFLGGARAIWQTILAGLDWVSEQLKFAMIRRAHKGKVRCQHEDCRAVATRYTNTPRFFCDDHVSDVRRRGDHAWWLDHARGDK
jgi:hypothetical protein